MKFKNAKKVLDEKVANKDMQQYAILVNVNGQKGMIFSYGIDENTYFDVASVGKAIVTTQLVLKAISNGKLTLDNTLGEFFDIADETKKNITIKQLLTHTAGLVRLIIPAEICARKNDVIAEHILSFDLAHKPGTKYRYSCWGMMLLGFILEKIYNQTLDEMFFDQIKHPLGIDRMRFNIAIDEDNAAVCYHRDEVGLRRMDDAIVLSMRNGVSGAGGSFWSIKAIETLVKAILAKDERLYSKDIFDLAEQSYTDGLAEKRGLGYGIDNMKGGVDLGDLFPEGSFGHMGWTGALVFMNRKANMYAIVLSNTRKCMLNKGLEYDENGDDLIYMHIRDVLNAVKTDLDEQELL